MSLLVKQRMVKRNNDLEIRAYKGVVQFIFVFWIVIFLPAWSLYYWQGWIYFAIFSISILIITAYFLKHDRELIERRLKGGPGGEKEKSQKIIQTITAVIFISLTLFPGFDHRFLWSQVPPYISVAADVLVALGFYIIFLVFKENSFTSAIIETDKNQKVISTGPYKIIRHPMYGGAFILFLAAPVAMGSSWGVLFSLLLTIMMAVRLLDEEKFLKKNLKGYEEYCRKTPFHLIPFIW